jgi:hypothetical protein
LEWSGPKPSPTCSQSPAIGVLMVPVSRWLNDTLKTPRCPRLWRMRPRRGTQDARWAMAWLVPGLPRSCSTGCKGRLIPCGPRRCSSRRAQAAPRPHAFPQAHCC